MENKNNIVKSILTNKGFSLTETLYTLFIILNIFVLVTQIFYNININEKLDTNALVIQYEVAILRIENNLKEGNLLFISENELRYTYRNQEYRYYVNNNRFTLDVDDGYTIRKIYYLYDISSVKFTLMNDHLLSITLSNSFKKYEGWILI